MIREAQESDAINLAALSIQVWLHTYARQGIRRELSEFVITSFTDDYFKTIINETSHRILVYTQEDHLVGYVMVNLESLWKDASNGYEIDKLYVQEHFQRKGIGRCLLLEAKKRYGQPFWLSTWSKNENGIGFYKHFGFIDIGHTYFKLDNELHENRVLMFRTPDFIS